MFSLKRPACAFAPLILALIFSFSTAYGQRQMEKLGRGVIAIKTSSTQVYVGWRLLGNDPSDIAFNLYRSANGGAPVQIATALTATTNYLDTPGSLSTTDYTYTVKPVLNGVVVTDTWANPLSGGFTLKASVNTRQYIPVPIQPTPDDAAAGVSYDVKFCWVGDFDGDGEYDFLIDRTNPNVEAKQWLQAYKRDGTLLWQMDMGPNSVDHYNITPGSSSVGIGHGDNVTVYDLDGDGKAEAIVRTANGVVFANGTTLAAPNNEVQYISIIDGLTGAEKARATVPIPSGWATKTHVQGQMGIVYADGVRPSLFFHPSNRNPDESFNKCAITWDYRNGQLTQRWVWLESGHTAEGHQIRFADVDNDGKDEYVDIGNIVKSDGSGQINENVLTEVVHGDRYHVADIDPDRPGQEMFLIQQNNGNGLATAYSAADKSAVIRKWYAGGVVDVGRGVIGDFVPTVKGLEFFSTQPGVFNAKGDVIPNLNTAFPPETIWWDGDLGREFLSTIGSSATSPGIDKFNTNGGGTGRVLSLYSDPNAPNSPFNNYIAYGGRPQFWGDILGDWREELLCVAQDNSELRIYTTNTMDTAKTSGGVPFRIYTLMHNPQYRIQATTKGYVQSSYVDYYLGNEMTPPPPPPMVDAKLVWRGGTGATTWDAGTTSSWLNGAANSTFADGDTVRFDISGNNTTAVTLTGTLSPGAVTVYNPKDYTFSGAGVLAGTMKLTKAGAGTMTLPGTHTFTGGTTVWDGALLVNGDLQGSPVTVWGGTWGGALAAGKTGGRIGGTGTFSKAVTVKYRGAITPGAGMGSVGAVTFGAGLTMEDGTTMALDLSDTPATATSSDRIAVTGNLTLTGKVNIVVKPVSNLAAGTYTLLTYTGALTGGTSNLNVIVPAGTPYTLAAAGGAITLTVPTTRAPAAVTWRGTGANWDLSTSQTWLKSGVADVFVSGDTVTFDATGAAAPTVNLTTALPVGGVTVNSTSNYTFNGVGSISGAGGLSKTGTGTLTINTINDYTGATTVTGGVLEVAALGDAGAPSSIGASTSAATNFVINGGTLRLTGAQTNTNRNITLGASGGTIDVASASSSIQISGALSGSGTLTKTGAGTVLLASANTYTGGTVINAGTIYLAGATPNSSGLGTGTVTINNGTLTMADVQASETAAWNLIVPSGATGRLNSDGRCSLTGSLTGAGTFTFYTSYVRTDLKGNWAAFTGKINVVADSDGGDFRITNSNGFGTAAINLGAQVYAYYNVTSSTATLDIGELSGTSTATLLGAPTAGRTVTWRIGGRNTDSTYNGVIANSSGPAAVTKIGTGTLTLLPTETTTLATSTTTAGSPTVTVTSTTGLLVSMPVSGTGIPAGTRIAAVPSATTLTLTNAATASGSITLTCTSINNYSGATTVSAGTLALPGTLTNATTVEVLSGATLNLTGELTTGTLTIRAGGRLIGGGTVNATVINEGLIEATGGARFTFKGALTNSATGTMRFLGGAGFTQSGGTFTNNGTLDLLTAGAVTLPTAGTGKTYTPTDLQAATFSLAGGVTPTLTLFTLSGHNYQLARCTDIANPVWTPVGPAQPGNNAIQSFIDSTPPASPNAFYHVVVSP